MYTKDYTVHQFKAAAYVRLSREDGDKLESDSIANQKSFIERYVQNIGNVNVFRYYVDDGFTGTNFERPSFKDMIMDMELGKIDCVIVKDLSRFGRDYIDVGKYLERVFPKNHIRFIAITDGIDNLNQRYDISMPIKNIVNAQYSEDISKKVLASVSMKQKSGLFIGAFSSYGYMKDPKDKNQLIIDEPAALIVRRIYQMFTDGVGTQSIAKRLNAEGIPCPSVYKNMNGYKYRNSNKLERTDYWTYSTVRSILKKQMYIGDMVQHITNASRYNYDDRIVPESERIIVSGTHEAIISREMWENAQSIMKSRYKSTALNSSHIFSGILKCKDCGRGMTKINSRGVTYLACGSYKRLGSSICSRHNIRMSELYDIVLDAINEHIQKLCNIEAAITNTSVFKKRNSDMEKRIEALQDSVENLKTKKKSMYSDYQDKLLTREEYIEYSSMYAKDIQFMSNEIARLNEEIATSPKQEVEKEWFQNLIRYKKISSLSREALMSFIDVIYVSEPSPKKIILEIVFNFKDKISSLEEIV